MRTQNMQKMKGSHVNSCEFCMCASQARSSGGDGGDANSKTVGLRASASCPKASENSPHRRSDMHVNVILNRTRVVGRGLMSA
jgi:hypothetical protein